MHLTVVTKALLQKALKISMGMSDEGGACSPFSGMREVRLAPSDAQRIMLVGPVVSKCPSVCEPAAPSSFLITQIVSLHPQGFAGSVGQG